MFNTRSGGQGDLDDDAEINVTHFIPSVHLKGTRAEKLERLDLLITHLEGRADRWWEAGLVIAAAFVLVMLGVRTRATSSDDTFSMHASPRMARLVPSVSARVQPQRRLGAATSGNGKFSARPRKLFASSSQSADRVSRFLYQVLSVSLRPPVLP